ncbi:MAG TPA: CBS domain-containing protein, partial [Longilinea sp.]|nr:CBS domain-containing protein [Longilinea sp.]
IWSVTPETTVYEALQLMAQKDIGTVLVMENDRLIGIMSERDYARKVILLGRSSKETSVKEIMSTEISTVQPDQTLDEAMAMMSIRHIRHLPVLSKDKVIGVISISDVVRGIIARQRETIQFYEDIELDR